MRDPPLTSMSAPAASAQSHPAYRAIADRCGTTYLARTLNSVRECPIPPSLAGVVTRVVYHIPSLFLRCAQLLISHIRATLPDLRQRIFSQTADVRQQLALLGGEFENNKVRSLFKLCKHNDLMCGADFVWRCVLHALAGCDDAPSTDAVCIQLQGRHRRAASQQEPQ